MADGPSGFYGDAPAADPGGGSTDSPSNDGGSSSGGGSSRDDDDDDDGGLPPGYANDAPASDPDGGSTDAGGVGGGTQGPRGAYGDAPAAQPSPNPVREAVEGISTVAERVSSSGAVRDVTSRIDAGVDRAEQAADGVGTAADAALDEVGSSIGAPDGFEGDAGAGGPSGAADVSVGVGSGPTTSSADDGLTRDTVQDLGTGFRRNVAEPVGDAARVASPATELDRVLPGNPVGRTVEGVNEGAINAFNAPEFASGGIGIAERAARDTRRVDEQGAAGRRQNRQELIDDTATAAGRTATAVADDPIGTLSRAAGAAVAGGAVGAGIGRGATRAGSRGSPSGVDAPSTGGLLDDTPSIGATQPAGDSLSDIFGTAGGPGPRVSVSDSTGFGSRVRGSLPDNSPAGDSASDVFGLAGGPGARVSTGRGVGDLFPDNSPAGDSLSDIFGTAGGASRRPASPARISVEGDFGDDVFGATDDVTDTRSAAGATDDLDVEVGGPGGTAQLTRLRRTDDTDAPTRTQSRTTPTQRGDAAPGLLGGAGGLGGLAAVNDPTGVSDTDAAGFFGDVDAAGGDLADSTDTGTDTGVGTEDVFEQPQLRETALTPTVGETPTSRSGTGLGTATFGATDTATEVTQPTRLGTRTTGRTTTRTPTRFDAEPDPDDDDERRPLGVERRDALLDSGITSAREILGR